MEWAQARLPNNCSWISSPREDIFVRCSPLLRHSILISAVSTDHIQNWDPRFIVSNTLQRLSTSPKIAKRTQNLINAENASRCTWDKMNCNVVYIFDSHSYSLWRMLWIWGDTVLVTSFRTVCKNRRFFVRALFDELKWRWYDVERVDDVWCYLLCINITIKFDLILSHQNE